MTAHPESRSRRRWTAQEKAALVRRHLRDQVPVGTLADEAGVAPSQIHNWVRLALDGVDQVLVDKRRREDRRKDDELAAKDARIRQLEEVAAELSMEVLQLKKAPGAT